ncbi:HPP family protein [Neorhizobium lilium]|uniref:HPP family protein n=1 Tax=Neorhizobium lilium TaxID=2503024 RepID=A0A3S3RUA0_9HYPH|nr:HPP family protein [Neorhizobium lilium]RWX78219.1 HPP family protein [Neorhizobium lilium]
MQSLLLRRLWPDSGSVSLRERIRSGSGALAGILVTGLIGGVVAHHGAVGPALIAPMGASAVLLFAVPSSPLAQPWSILCGNLVSALVGVTAALWINDLFLASAIAISVAILAMLSLRCLHPPSGAIALTAVLGGPAVHDLGYSFALWPVLGNSVVLLAAAIIFNNLTGRPYPRAIKPTPADHGTADRPATQRLGFTSEDLDDVLKDYDEFIDVKREDLEEILRRTELRSYRHRAGRLDCAAVMSRDVIAVAPGTSLNEAYHLMRAHHIKALPVTNDQAQVVGIVTQTDFLDKAAWAAGRPTIGVRQRLRLAQSGATAPNETVKDIMTAPVKTIAPEASLSEAIIMFAGQGLHYLPVTRSNTKLAGILSQSDVLAAMLADQAVLEAATDARQPV